MFGGDCNHTKHSALHFYSSYCQMIALDIATFLTMDCIMHPAKFVKCNVLVYLDDAKHMRIFMADNES